MTPPVAAEACGTVRGKMVARDGLAILDEDTVRRAQQGDAGALEVLAERGRPLVQRYVTRFLGDPIRAEDLTQTTLMKACSRVGDLRTPKAFAGWLLRIARNECLNEVARQRHQTLPLSSLDGEGDDVDVPTAEGDDPEELLVRHQLRTLVRQVADTLPDHYRRTLTMRALEDRSYEEISARLGVPIDIARLWYCRARKRFRTAFIEAMVSRRQVPAGCGQRATAIAAMIEGSLPRSERDSLQGHLADCPVCRQTEEELRNTAFRTPAHMVLAGLGLGLVRLASHLRRVLTEGTSAPQAAVRLLMSGTGTAALATAGALTGVSGALTVPAPAIVAVAPAVIAVPTTPTLASTNGTLSPLLAPGSSLPSSVSVLAEAPNLDLAVQPASADQLLEGTIGLAGAPLSPLSLLGATTGPIASNLGRSAGSTLQRAGSLGRTVTETVAGLTAIATTAPAQTAPAEGGGTSTSSATTSGGAGAGSSASSPGGSATSSVPSPAPGH